MHALLLPDNDPEKLPPSSINEADNEVDNEPDDGSLSNRISVVAFPGSTVHVNSSVTSVGGDIGPKKSERSSPDAVWAWFWARWKLVAGALGFLVAVVGYLQILGVQA